MKVSLATHMHIQENSQDALNEFYPYYAAYFLTHTPSQYRAQQVTRADYDQRASQHGPIFVGSPQQIVDKILYERELLGHQRFLAQIDIGGLPFAKVARVIELLQPRSPRQLVAAENRFLSNADTDEPRLDVGALRQLLWAAVEDDIAFVQNVDVIGNCERDRQLLHDD